MVTVTKVEEDTLTTARVIFDDGTIATMLTTKSETSITLMQGEQEIVLAYVDGEEPSWQVKGVSNGEQAELRPYLLALSAYDNELSLMGALSISRDDRIDTRGAHLYCRAMHVLGSQKPSLYDLARDLRNSEVAQA